MSNGFPPESTNPAILHARQCLATIGDTKMVQIGREQLQWLVEAAMAYEAYDRQCAWVQVAGVGPLGWHVGRIMTDMIYAAYPALRPAIDAHRAKVAEGQVTSTVTLYLVWSNEHRAWWKPDSRGYTRFIDRAGRYSRAEAIKIAQTRGGGWPDQENPYEIAIPEADAIAQATRPFALSEVDIIADLLAQARAK